MVDDGLRCRFYSMSAGQQEARPLSSACSSDLHSGAIRGQLKAETSSLLP